MATKTIKYDSFKIGDTPVFSFSFTPPYVGFDWTGVTIDGAITGDAKPASNTSAVVSRSNEILLVATDNTASWSMQPTPVESNNLQAGVKYHVEVQLKQGTLNVVTPITGEVQVEQDYVK